MKKSVRLLAILLVTVFLVSGLLSCNKKEYYLRYFNEFDTQPPFSKAVSQIGLDENVKVYSYDSLSNVFVTKMTVANSYSTGESDKTLTLYGIADTAKQYVLPIYSNVLHINGDYAIVTKPFPYTSGGTTVLAHSVGVVKFRGENAGEKTDFTSKYLEFNPAFDQFLFVGDYIAVPGTKTSPTTATNFTTFYEYKSKDTLLERFKVACDYNYRFAIYDEILVATNGSYGYFFDTKSILQNGFLELGEYDVFKAFPEDTADEYTDLISIQIHYLGNGVFTRTSRLDSDTAFTGYTMVYDTYDAGTGEGKIMYATVRTDIFNFYTKSAADQDWLIVNTVANKYTFDAFAYTADALNNTAIAEEGRYVYYQPVLNPAAFIKDGYSIVYFYYLPYVDVGNYTYEISFCIMDSKANIIKLDEVLMPLFITDGVGIQNVDPTFESILGDFQYTAPDKKTVTLKGKGESGNTYETYYANNGIVIGTEYDFTNLTIYFGAFDAQTKKQVLPFIYNELTPYYGDYAVGTRTENGKLTTFRLDKSGKETLINDAVNVKQGVYVYESKGKLGVKNYEGTVLIEAHYSELEVYDVFNSGGIFQKSFVIATTGKNTYIYTLE